MKLIYDIIELLSDKNASLEATLLKTKILLFRIGQHQAVAWVNSELNGYSSSDNIPKYRVVNSRVVITATDGFTARWTNYPVPIMHLPKSMQETLTHNTLGQSVSFLEHLAVANSDVLVRPLPTEMCHLLSEGLANGVYAESANMEIAKAQILQVLTQIRSRLLDFLLELSEKMPSDESKDLKQAAKDVDANQLFSNAIFGDNATIIIGENNTQSVSNNISYKEPEVFSDLISLIKSANLPSQNEKSLVDCVEVMADSHRNGTFANAYKDFMQNASAHVTIFAALLPALTALL